MAEGKGDPTKDGAGAHDDEEQDVEDREAILGRRSRFIVAAIAGLAGASAVACGKTSPQPCLSYSVVDAGDDAEPGSDGGDDAEPQPCLSPLPPDAGDDAEPQACLSLPPDDAG